MGGNVKDAFTDSEPVEKECKNCGYTFKDESRSSSRNEICGTCRDNFDTIENIEVDFNVEIDSDSISFVATLSSKVPYKVSVQVPTDELDGENIVGLLRIEGDNGAWYEDAWVYSKGYHRGFSVTDEESFEAVVGRDEGTNQEVVNTFVEKSPTHDKKSVREEYQSSDGDLMQADTVLVSFDFVAEGLGGFEEEFEMPSYLVDL